jgi:hypothetical protein
MPDGLYNGKNKIRRITLGTGSSNVEEQLHIFSSSKSFD